MQAAQIPDPAGVWRKMKSLWSRSVHRYLHLQSREQIAQAWRVEGGQRYLDARRAGTPLIMAFLHLGPWEEGLQVLGGLGEPACCLVRRIPFAHFEKEVQRRRALAGHRFLDSQEGGRELVRHLQVGGIALVAADLFPRTGGIRMEWLGRPAWVDDKPARLARQTGAVLLPVWCEEGVAHLEPPIDTRDPIQATQELMRLAESRIRQHPHLWIWMHRRWREKRQ